VGTEEARKRAGKLRLDHIEERLSGINRDREQLVKRMQHGSSSAVSSSGRFKLDNHQQSNNFANFDAVPLSPQGQVQRLIEEALDEDKLSRMFVGWCPFI